jgi:polyhydroxybutyrate depolymerase
MMSTSTLPFLMLAALCAQMTAAETAGSLEITVGTQPRTCELTMPATDGSSLRPLIIVLHGGTGNGAGMRAITSEGFDSISRRDGVVVCYPNALHGHWNDDRGAAGAKPSTELADDTAFIRALIQELIRSRKVDPHRVYATGISNGAIFCYRLARELGPVIAAIAPVCGLLPVDARPLPWRVRVPALLIVGTADPLMPCAGGNVGGRLARGKVCSVEDTITALKVWNQVVGDPIQDPPVDAIAEDGTALESARWIATATPDVPTMQVLRIVGGGHTWPGGKQYLSERLIGRTSREVGACEAIWSFCRRHVSAP